MEDHDKPTPKSVDNWSLDVQNLRLRFFDSRAVVSAAYSLFGLFDLTIFALSGLNMIHMGALGVLSMALAVGLFLGKPTVLWLAIAFTPLIITTGAATLYASIGFYGFATNTQVIMLKLGLTLYTTAASVLLIYLVSKRKSLLG